MIKTLNKMVIEGKCLNIIKAIYDKISANIIVNAEKLKVFFLRPGAKQGYPLSPFSFSFVLEALARTVRQEKEIKGIHFGNKEVKSSCFADDMNLYIENLKVSTEQLL